MKQITKYLLSFCAMALLSTALHAQNTVTVNGVGVNVIRMQPVNDRLNVGMMLDLSDMKVRSNKSLRITPVLTDGNEMIQLPAVVIDGRRRQIVHERHRDADFVSPDIYVRRHNRRDQVVEYGYDVAYRPWMDNSELVLREEWCGCHDRTLSEDLVSVASLERPTPQVKRLPHMVYVTPRAEMQQQQKQTALYFPVNKSAIDPSYMDNKQQIDDLRDIFADTKRIDAVRLMGYASPEGPYDFNKSLAAKRAAAVEEYLKANNLGSGVKITADSAPANWDAVKQMLTQSCINNYRYIVNIIDDDSIKPADKNAAIRRAYPVEYDFMLRTWYPRLRTTDITVDYQARRPSVDEAKRILRSNPSQLSLADIYMVALTYEKGSKEWNDIIILAVNTYPQSPEARVNAANVAMANGNYPQAAAYLQGVPADMPEAMNSRGILAMSQGDYDQAMDLFRKAQQAGVSEAAYNISLLRELMQLDK